jgi:hypothetical protein
MGQSLRVGVQRQHSSHFSDCLMTIPYGVMSDCTAVRVGISQKSSFIEMTMEHSV